ncbi:family S53 protease [Epithele typhae]|uniref:family S53 protease n=1 Tax=Epithele typhae TaxID=378194 RepID=UPI002007F2C4|nr:family S53 protease [Epithele typhae]KAH9923703.1 family S53 protease [Epithele typhae]
MLVTVGMGKPATPQMKVHELLKNIPDGFSAVAIADPEQTLKLRIALVQSNFAELERRLYDVSTPSSTNYGKYLSKAEVQGLVAPKQDSVEAVDAWMKESGLTATSVSSTGEWISFEVPVRKANELFDANFTVFENADLEYEVVRTLSYSIPVELEGHLDLVHPTVTSVVTFLNNHPACLQALYGIPTTPATQYSNRLAVTGFIKQYANTADLETFLSKFRPDMPSSTTFTLDTIDGGSNPQQGSQAGTEANLDIQYTVGMATNVPTLFISVGEDTQDGGLEGFLDVVNFLLEMDSPPQVLTTSYGQNEDTMSRNLAKFGSNLCNAYAQLGARGTSILFSSGDGGVGGSHPSVCFNFVPTFPSGCPFLTSVGATQGTSPETAAYFSSGGFSNYFPTPEYQADDVADYLAALGSDTYAGRFNASGRAFPDVAAQGVDFEIVVDGKTEAVSGTSCSSPLYASVISLVNDRLIAARESPMGFLNPFLYSAAGRAALTDITSGSNPGCLSSGFPARAGWDPVTGLGTPDFDRLLAAVGL